MESATLAACSQSLYSRRHTRPRLRHHSLEVSRLPLGPDGQTVWQDVSGRRPAFEEFGSSRRIDAGASGAFPTGTDGLRQCQGDAEDCEDPIVGPTRYSRTPLEAIE
jgi:hypothetical protein